MSVNAITLAQINSELQAINVQLNALMNRVNLLFVGVAQGIGLAGLQAVPYSLSAADAQAVMNSITDMWHFFQVYQGLYFVVSGLTAGSGVPTVNGASTFGYVFESNISKTGGLGY